MNIDETCNTIEEAIFDIESDYLRAMGLDPADSWVRGSALTRVLLHPEGRGWSLMIGLLMERKVEFRGPSICAVIDEAAVEMRKAASERERLGVYGVEKT